MSSGTIQEAPLILLDGPMGTELSRRGVDTSLPRWSASALLDAPDVVAEIHRDYALAGAQVHTTNTFRTRARTMGEAWRSLARRAVQIARESVPDGHRVAGSVAPVQDCYRPDLSPPDCREEHRELIEVLVDAGCDLLLVETFPLAREAWIAVEEASRLGIQTWASFTAGPEGKLLTPTSLGKAAKGAVERGAAAVLINCTAANRIEGYLDALAEAGVPYGAYGNAGTIDDEIGWNSDAAFGASRYAALARRWISHGATLVGGCCGTGPAHVEAMRLAIED